MKRHYSDRFTGIPALILDIDVIAAGTDRILRVPAKIDTGADISVIPVTAAEALKLIEFGSRPLRAVGHPTFVAITYWGMLNVEGRSFDIEMATHDRPYALLGRDVINQFILRADGPAERFELLWPGDSPNRKRRQ